MSDSTKRKTIEEQSLYQSHPHASKRVNFNDENFNILALQADRGGCGWYRVRQYIQQIQRDGLANAHLIEGNETEEQLQRAVELADVILVRNGNYPMVTMIQDMYPDKKIVFDHDDYTFAISPFNEHYKDFGVKDVEPMWVTGKVPGFNRFKNKQKQMEMRYMLETSTLNTSPVEGLSQKWAQFNGNGAVVPNGIDFTLYPELSVSDPSKGSEIRIGWQGGISHVGDIGSIAPELVNVLKKDDNRVFYSAGSHYRKFFEGVEDRCRVFEWTDFKAHPYRMRSFDLDVAIIPLEDIDFNDYKSEVKFAEFAALGVPCLVKNRLPYSEVCENEVNCLTYDTPEEFEEQLERLLSDEGLRDKLSVNAYKWVREERDMGKLAEHVVDNVYKKL